MAAERRTCAGQRWTSGNTRTPCEYRGTQRLGDKWYCSLHFGGEYENHRRDLAAAEQRVVAASFELRQWFAQGTPLTDWNGIVMLERKANDALSEWRAAVDALAALRQQEGGPQ